MKLFNITDIFTNVVTMSASTLEAFYDQLKSSYEQLRKDKDVDNLRVLRNRIATIVEVNESKYSRKEISKLQKIRALLEDIDDTIGDIIAEQKEEIQLIDIEKKFQKKFAPKTVLSRERKKTHVLVEMRKSDISYEEEMLSLQIELVKLQKYIQLNGKKVLIIFEGRDAAGKWGNIKRFMENLNPRSAKVVALQKPTDIEKGQWYFERYIAHLPNAWEIAFFDRSWYNRAWVEPVMGFVGKKDYEKFINDAPVLEKMLVNSGIKVIKFYFSVSKEEQARRFAERKNNPLKQFKLSPIDQYSQKLWDRYTMAEYLNFSNTHTDYAPWTVIRSDDKEASRINAIKYLLNQFDYPEKIDEKRLKIDEDIVVSGKQKARILQDEIDTKINLFE